MKILKEKEYKDLLMKSKQRLLYRAKLDKISLLLDQHVHGKNIFTVMRDIKNVMRDYK